MIVEKIEQVPEAAMQALMKYFLEEFDNSDPIENMDELISSIQDAGESNERKEYWDIVTEYILNIGDWKFIASGSQYLKDHCICDMEMSDVVEIIDVVSEKLDKKKKKEIKAIENKSKWIKFFENKSKEEIISVLFS